LSKKTLQQDYNHSSSKAILKKDPSAQKSLSKTTLRKTALTPLAKHSFRRILEQEDASAEQPSLQKQSSYIEQDASAKRLFGKTTLLQEDL
jgi:hypothetical protein